MAQKIVRGFLARKQHRPRFNGIMKINSIKSNLAKTKEIASQLKINKDEILRQVQEMEKLIEESIKKIKVNIFNLWLMYLCNHFFSFCGFRAMSKLIRPL